MARRIDVIYEGGRTQKVTIDFAHIQGAFLVVKYPDGIVDFIPQHRIQRVRLMDDKST